MLGTDEQKGNGEGLMLSHSFLLQAATKWTMLVSHVLQIGPVCSQMVKTERMNSMPMLVNNLSTGDVMVFDKEKRDLYLIPKHNAKQWHDARDKSLHFVKELAERGTAKHFDRVALAALQAALSHIVLLAVPGT